MTHIRRAQTREEIEPLIELCKAGKLFEIQDWIAAGKPVNPPPPPPKGNRPKTPLEIAMDRGFHSLVRVLLEGGAVGESEDCDCPLYDALGMRRLDMVQLLVEHGYNPQAVDMVSVFHSWDPEIMEYFIERGAEVEAGNPLARALCARIRTALRILKQYRDRFPSFQDQANIALRQHCKEGHMKWISLMLWAGADPYAPGPVHPDEEPDPDDEDDGLPAVGWAALYGHFEVFKLKKIRLDPELPAMREVLRYSCKEEGWEVVKTLLGKGMDPNDQENGGCSVIQSLLTDMSWVLPRDVLWGWERERKRRNIDTQRSRSSVKFIHLLVKHGGRWVPTGREQINDARRSLLKLAPDYTVEFVWIMAKYQACTQESIEALLRTATIKSHISTHRERINELLAAWS